MPEDDGTWTIVMRRRASKPNHSSPPRSAFRYSHVPRTRTKAPARVQPNPVDGCDEALLLQKMKRSLARVEDSTFFKRFLDQAHSPSVFGHIFRVVSSHSSLENAGSEGKVLAASTPARKSAYDSGDEIDLGIMSSKIGVCEGEKETLECRNAWVSAVSMRSSKSTDTALECTAAYVSEMTTNGCGGTNCSDVTCACMVKLLGDKNGGETEWKCRSVLVSLMTSSAQPIKGLTLTAGIEEDSCSKRTGNKQPCIQIIAYGLGSIVDSEVSRCQLALILLMKQRFVWVGDVQVYDPVLSKWECKVIEGLGCSSITVNEEGRRSIEGPTIFYMPHCEDWLYNNVLQANWTPQKLCQLAILGNSFYSYKDRWSSLIGVRSKPPPAYVLEFQQVAEEIPLEATASLELPAFNNMSWHFYQQPKSLKF